MSNELLLWLGIFIVSLAVLVKSSDWFTDAAEKIGLLLGLPSFIIGVTIVSIGTSLPELVSSVVAVSQGSSEIVFGNVVGSNIANIFLIIGIASVASKKLNISYELIHVDLPLFVGSAFLLFLTVADRNYSSGEAIICIACFLVYCLYTISQRNPEEEDEDSENSKGSILIQALILGGSSAAIFFGANYTIESITKLSEIVGIGKDIIAVSAVALGTSLPELLVTISAAKKGDPELAVGNVLGSNIFNTLMVMGIPGLIGKLVISEDLVTDGLITMLVGTLLFFFVTQDKQVTRWEGLLFFIFYGWFVGNLFDFI
ncbi:MAG: calcium/sodium antiporter [Oscillatoria sp. SIO1A7]|nr:calcium/sodium antiporter [Oscillatoria sp. SIO1A7]